VTYALLLLPQAKVLTAVMAVSYLTALEAAAMPCLLSPYQGIGSTGCF